MEWQFGVKQSYFEANPIHWMACGVCSIYFALRKMGYRLAPFKLVSIVRKELKFEILNTKGLSISDIEMILSLFGIMTKIKLFGLDSRKDFYKCLNDFATPNLPLFVFPLRHVIAVTEVKEKIVYYLEPDDLNNIISCKSFFRFCDYVYGRGGIAKVMILHPT